MCRAIGAAVRAVSTNKRLLSRAALQLTPAAVNRIKELLEGNPEAIGMKFSVEQRGCGGSKYSLGYATKKGKFDEEVNQDGVKVLIDAKALLTLLGTEVDYTEEKLASGFVFNNPNVKGSCGCGESFIS